MRPFSRRSEDAIAILILTVLIAVAFADILFFHRVLYIRDVARFFEPNFAVLRDLIRFGDLPFWNNRYNAGQPFAANPAYAALYPPQWIFPSLQLEVVAHYLLGAAGMYLFLRSLGLRAAAALFGAVSFALGGVMLSLSNLTNVLFGVAWFPWLGLAVRRRHFALAALVLGTILIIGDQATILQAGFLLMAFFIWRREWKPALLVFACAFLAGSAQIIPALDHQMDSGRARPLAYAAATQWMLPPARLLELALPTLFGSFREWTFYWAGRRLYGTAGVVPWVFSFYNGMLVFVLACAGFIRRVRGYKIAASYIAFSIVAASTPLLYFLGLRSIRYPEKFFISGVFVLTVFAAMVLDQLAELRGTAAAISAAIAVASALTLLLPFDKLWQISGYYGDLLEQWRSGAVVTAGIAAVLALLLALRRLPLAWLALVVLADLAPRVPGLKPTIDGSYYDPPPIARELQGGRRLYNDADWQLMFAPTPHIPVEQHAWRVRNALLPNMQQMWDISGVLEDDITRTDLKPTIDFRRAFLFARAQGRTAIVQDFLRAAGTTYVAELRDASDAANPIRLVRLGHPRFYFAPGAGRVVSASERPNAIDLDVEANARAVLFIAVTRHKYWKAVIDGMPSTTHPSNIAFQAMQIPPGRHHVALRYRNPLVILFGFVSLLSAAALLAAHFVAQHRGRGGDVERLDAA